MEAVRVRPQRWIDFEMLRLIPWLTGKDVGLLRWSDEQGWEKRLLLQARDTGPSDDMMLVAFRDEHYKGVSRPAAG